MQSQQNSPQKQVIQDSQPQANHSLSADLAMGWRPKLKVIGPIPLNFDNEFIDRSIKELLKSQASIYEVIYLGPRPSNTFKMHQTLKKKYKYKYQHLFSVQYGHLKAFFHKFYSQFEPKMKLPFLGMNPKYKSYKIVFDSFFESGNLDSVVKVTQNQYDLVLRIDSNTAGHIMWYYFRVSNTEDISQRIKLNIVNLRRNKSCYQRGMKPFIRRKKRSINDNEIEESWTGWVQGGQNVQVNEDKIRFAKQNLIFSNGLAGLQQPPRIFRYISFQLEFQPFQQIQIAYCIPYTYTDLTNDLKILKQSVMNQKIKNLYFEIDNNNESLSGLEIPILKITQNQNDKYDEQTEKNKHCIFIIGRQHPGESNASFVMKGILQQLIKNNKQMNFLRKHVVFKIIPMLNVDGVVMGNFRTSLYGKDLNRLFKKQQLFLIPQVQACKEQFSNLIKVHKNKVMLFLDIHGHSARRNSFCYGPGILDSNAFSDVRQLAKIIASKTEIFRYPSCSFRINQDKKTTARACFSKSVGLAYTIESSNWSFYSKSQAKLVDFTQISWGQIGKCVATSIYEYSWQKIQKKLQKKKKKLMKNDKNQIRTSERKNQNQSEGQKINLGQKKYQQIKQQQNFKIRPRQISVQLNGQKGNQFNDDQDQLQNHSEKSYDESKQINRKNKNRQVSRENQNNQNRKSPNKYHIVQIQQVQNQSDKMSDNQMDSDSEGQDMEKQKFQKYMNGAKKMMVQFQKVYFGQDYEKKGRTAAKLRNQAKKLLKDNSNKNFKKNTQILACLRKKQPISNPDLDSNPYRMIDIAGKIKLQARKNTKGNSAFMNAKINQNLLQDESGQNETNDMMLISKKVPFNKILPRIEQISPYAKRMHEMNLKGREKISRIEKWSQQNQTPQLPENEEHQKYFPSQTQYFLDQQEGQNEEYLNNQNIKIRGKSLSSYEPKYQSNLLRINTKQEIQNPPYETVQSKYQDFQLMENDQQIGWVSDHQFQQTPRGSNLKPQENINQKLKNLKRWSHLVRQQDSQKQMSSIRLIKQSYRYNMLNFNQAYKQNFQNKESAYDESQAQYSSKDTLQRLKENNRKILSSQELAVAKDKNLQLSEPFNHLKFSTQNQTNYEYSGVHVNKNHEKIQQIIISNLTMMQGNQKQHGKNRKQTIKDINLIQQKQNFSVQSIPMKGFNPKQLIKKQRKQTHQVKSTNFIQRQKIYPNGKRITDAPFISSSVILPRNEDQSSGKIKTLESQSLLRNEATNANKIKLSLSSNRNYSERKPDKQFDILKQEERINQRVMKFGGQSLPKIIKNQHTPSPKKYTAKNHFNRGILKQQQNSPKKVDKSPISIQKNSIIGSPSTDFTNIKLICIPEDKGNPKKDLEQTYTKQNFQQNSKGNNKQKLLYRLKQLQKEQREKFGEQNLTFNKELKLKSKEIQFDQRDSPIQKGSSINKQQKNSLDRVNPSNLVKMNFYSGGFRDEQIQESVLSKKGKQVKNSQLKQDKVFSLPVSVQTVNTVDTNERKATQTIQNFGDITSLLTKDMKYSNYYNIK